jgi:hypothetical protein
MALKACRECGVQVSTSAEVCPHCGIRAPTASNPLVALDGDKGSGEPPRRSRTARVVRTLLYAVAVIVGGYMALALIWKMNEGSLTTGLPSCGAAAAQSDAKSAIENAPIGKTFGVRIIDLRDAKEISRNDTEVQCTATVKLNSGVEGAFRYRFYIENGKLFVYAQLPAPDLGTGQDQPSGCTVSLAQYQKLATGMSYAAARQALGCEGTEMSRSDAAGYATVMYTWNGSTLGGNMNAMFQNDRLINKSQFGLR